MQKFKEAAFRWTEALRRATVQHRDARRWFYHQLQLWQRETRLTGNEDYSASDDSKLQESLSTRLQRNGGLHQELGLVKGVEISRNH
jgi:hypothetical protein